MDTGVSAEEREAIIPRAWLHGSEVDLDLAVDEVASWIAGAERIVALTGAGISTDSGIALARVEAGEADPPCPRCGGILKAATVLFGEGLDPEVSRVLPALVGG